LIRRERYMYKPEKISTDMKFLSHDMSKRDIFLFFNYYITYICTYVYIHTQYKGMNQI